MLLHPNVSQVLKCRAPDVRQVNKSQSTLHPSLACVMRYTLGTVHLPIFDQICTVLCAGWDRQSIFPSAGIF